MTYTYEETIELLERAVAEKGMDYVYDPGLNNWGVRDICRYVNSDRTPGCIVGQVLSYVGLLGRFTHETENMASAQPVIQNNFAPDAINALVRAQKRQDRGEPWGLAFDAAKGVAV